MIKRILYGFCVLSMISSCVSRSSVENEYDDIDLNFENSISVKSIEQKEVIVDYSAKTLPPAVYTVGRKLQMEFEKCRGIPYKYGGTSYKAFDCSGFVQNTFRKILKIQLPRSSSAMLNVGVEVRRSDLKIGDLVFFRPKRRYRHVGIYMGDDMFIHVSSSQGVTKTSLNSRYWKRCYHTARRVLK